MRKEMRRHKYADAIHAWAEGAELQFYNKTFKEWQTIEQPNFLNGIAYRIKPKQSEWWENIPEHGVLCWWNGMIITVIRRCNHYLRQGTNGTVEWVDGEVVPLTNEEIERFKR
jgi:hypothetical protein